MPVKTIESIVKTFETEYGLYLSQLPRKKIIFEGNAENGKLVIAVMPSSKIYPRGNGWVDLTKVQIELVKKYQIAIAAFRIADGLTYYVNFHDLLPLLTDQNMMENSREGEHWKLDIWSNKIVIRNGGQTLNVQYDEHQFINELL